MSYKLSIIVPARLEVCYEIDLLHETLSNLLENTTDACQIVIVLDGYWPPQPIPSHPRVTVIHHNQSIGQRAATNEGARIASGEWICKMDAHVAIGPEFDVRLLEGAQPDWTIVPGQYNLLAFEWKCKKCGATKDQGPKPAKCGSCNSRYLKQVKVWKPRDGKEGRRTAYTHSWRFDTTLTFQYWGQYASDEKHCKKHDVPFRLETQGKIHDTMCLLGACWAIRRERYFDLNICDEQFGSWGNQGVEVAIKTWLSGGELKVNQNTWFAHFFRVGGIGFPYEGGGRKERAVARSKELFLQNQWEKQVHPLSWLIEKFWPVPDWSTPGNPVWEAVAAAGEVFRPRLNSKPSSFSGSSDSATDNANPVPPAGSGIGEQVAVLAMGSSGKDGGERGSPLEIIPVVSNQSDMTGIAAGLIIADGVIQDRNPSAASSGQRSDKPCVHEPMGQFHPSFVANVSVAELVTGTNPDPAILGTITYDTRKNGSDSVGVQMADSEHLHGLIIPRKSRKGCLYYTCNSHDPLLEEAARANLKRSTNGHEIGCVSLQRTDFGDWTIVLDREKSGGTMHYQILAGLERSTADYVFLCESDVMYSPNHFDFTPPDDSTVYYNTNVWRVRWSDGHAVRTDNLQQVSGICANRQFLLGHYRKRVELIEANNGVFDVKRLAYEPGTRGDLWGVKTANWQSPYPNLDITGHGQTLTTPHFSIDSFRNPKYAKGWTETDDALPGWPKIAGRVQEWLREMADGS